MKLSGSVAACLALRHQQPVEKDQRQQPAAQPVERRVSPSIRSRSLPVRAEMHQFRERSLGKRKALRSRLRTMSAGIIASVSGMRSRSVVPLPGRDCRFPPCRRSSRRWCGPRPCPRRVRSRWLPAAAVEKPGRKISCSSSRSPAARRALRRDQPALDGLVPHPLHARCRRHRRTLRPPHGCPRARARSVSVPSGFLPAASRASGGFDAVIERVAHRMRQRVLDGLEQALVQLRLLALHLQPHAACPSCCERSRTMRGIFEKTFETGCMRAFITASRRSAVTMSRRRDSRSSSDRRPSPAEPGCASAPVRPPGSSCG